MCDGNCKDCNNKEEEVVDPQRRRFMSLSVGVINLAVLAGILAPVAGFIGSPLKKKQKDDWVDVIGLDDINVGETKEVSFKTTVEDGYQTVERKYVVFLKRHESGFIAFDPACTHLGCRINFNSDQGKYLCPCHGGVFDDDGKVLSGPPPQPLVRHGVRIEGGRVFVNRRAGIGA